MPGQVVALQLPNVPLFLTAYFGALKAGTAVLPLNPLLQAPEIEYHLTDSSARLLIAFNADRSEASRGLSGGRRPQSTRPAQAGSPHRICRRAPARSAS